MPKRVNTIPVVDFQGGLNLSANAMQLAENESPQLLNVDLDPLGGFRRRAPVHTIFNVEVSQPGQYIERLWALQEDMDQDILLCTTTGSPRRIWYTYPGSYNGYNPVWNYCSFGTSEITDIVQVNHEFTGPTISSMDKAYVFFGTYANNPVVRWRIGTDGSNVLDKVTLGQAYSEDFDAPGAGGNMPSGQVACAHREYMFVGQLTSSATRIRFSHPGNVEAWRADDYFDVGDSEPIISMKSFKDSLLIFKRHSVWELQGYDADTFSLRNITTEAGAGNAQAVVVDVDGVYFYSWPAGLYYYGPNGLEYKSAKLEGYINDLAIYPNDTNDFANLGMLGGRLYMSFAITWEGKDVLWDGIGPSFTFVLDPKLPNNSWTLHAYPDCNDPNSYDFADGGTVGLLSVRDYKGYSDVLGFGILDEGLQIVGFMRNDDAYYTDMIEVYTPHPPGASTWDDTYLPIDSYYTTGWQDLNNAAVIKSWGRPIVVMGNLEDAELEFDIYKDYDNVNSQRDFSLASDVSSTTTLSWGSPGGVGTWDNAPWAVPTGKRLGIKKGGRIGRATAVAMKVKCSQQFKSWSVDSIVWKYIPKRVRS